VSTPTFSLAACPRCSSFSGGLQQPFWRYAHNTSARRKLNCYLWLGGCRHAEAIAPAAQIYDEPDEWAKIEALWNMTAVTMFNEMTATWSPILRDRWLALLESRSYVEGTTREMEMK
jgi:hypothetical protein